MQKRLLLIFMTLLLVISTVGLVVAPALADSPNGNGNGQLKFKDKITPADKKAAVALFQEQFQAALDAGGVTLAADLDPGGTPHYFGPYPNWAYSPLPRGVIASIELTDGGSGYTDPTVEITDLYYGAVADPASATATVEGGVITGITVDPSDPGSGYSAPNAPLLKWGQQHAGHKEN